VLEAAKKGSGWELRWVKGHSGVEGNERADRRAKEAVMKGIWHNEPNLATPAGIKQTYPSFRRETHEVEQRRAKGPHVPVRLRGY